MDPLTVALAIVVLILALIFWFVLSLPAGCPECGARRGSEIGREPLGMRAVPMDGGGRAGVQVRYNVRYRCGECEAAWVRVETETS